MILWAGHVDRGGNKVTNLALSCLVGAIGLACAVVSTNFWVSFGWLTVSLAGINAARGIFFTIPMRFLTGIALAGGLAFINSIGTAGGFVGPCIFGWLTERNGGRSARARGDGGVPARGGGTGDLAQTFRDAGMTRRCQT